MFSSIGSGQLREPLIPCGPEYVGVSVGVVTVAYLTPSYPHVH